MFNLKNLIRTIQLIIMVILFITADSWSIDEYENYSNLYVLIPGINTFGQKMLENAKHLFKYDSECTIIIQEAKRWSSFEISETIKKATGKAIEKKKDVIVLLDMDLEHNVILSHLTPKLLADLPIVGTRWFASVDWAGATANLVSLSYKEAGGKGKKVLDCHSAGCDGFESSLRFAPINEEKKVKMFDEVFLFNGRTSGSELAKLLKESNYSWDQVKLFLNRGDLPANPHSISNIDYVIKYAGENWIVFYCKEIQGHPMDHSVLINR